MTASPPGYLQAHPDGVLLALKVVPRASRNELAGAMGNELKVKVTAPPVDSAANEALIRFLSELLDRPKATVRLLRGQTSRHKQILIAGGNLQDIASRLAAHS